MKPLTSLLVIFALYGQLVASRIPGPGGTSPSGGGATWTVVQHKAAELLDTTVAVAVTVSSTSAGNLLVACGGITDSARTLSSITDNASGGSNTYTVNPLNAKATDSAGFMTSCGYVLTAANAGATTVTMTFSGTSTTLYKAVNFWEVHLTSGSANLDSANNVTNGTGSGTTLSGPSITTTGNPGFLAAIVFPNDKIVTNPKAANECSSGGDIQTSGPAGASVLTLTAAAHQCQWVDNSSADSFASSAVSFK